MHRQLVTRTYYLGLLNSRLRKHSDYVEGMEFVFLSSSDPDTAAGFDWLPGGANPPRVFAEVAAQVHALFRVEDL